MTLAEKAKEVFKNYPAYQRIYATNDGNIFLDKVNAENNASTLDTEVIIFDKDDLDKNNTETLPLRKVKKS